MSAALFDAETPLAECVFVAVDLETTGWSPKNSEVIEIGAVLFDLAGRAATYSQLVNPRCSVPPAITEVTGITNAMVRTAPTLLEVLPRFLTMTAGYVFVGHNLPFDTRFLAAGAQRFRLNFSPRAEIDTMRLAKKAISTEQCGDHKLASLGSYFGAPPAQHHRALSDAVTTQHVLRGLLDAGGWDSLEQVAAAGAKR